VVGRSLVSMLSFRTTGIPQKERRLRFAPCESSPPRGGRIQRQTAGASRPLRRRQSGRIDETSFPTGASRHRRQR
jgi:hypothetical protein